MMKQRGTIQLMEYKWQTPHSRNHQTNPQWLQILRLHRKHTYQVVEGICSHGQIHVAAHVCSQLRLVQSRIAQTFGRHDFGCSRGFGV